MSEKHSPDSLKYQWRIIGLVLRSGWATSLDKSIAYEIVDNYRKEFGNSRASLSYLVEATGADRKSVIASTRRLVENGPFSIARQGAGTRPTEYAIDFGLVQEKPSSGASTTTTAVHPSGGVDTTTGGGVDTTTSGSSSGADTTESVLPVAAYKADVQDRMIDPAPPSAPLADGLKATAAGSAGERFEELYRVYGNRQRKAEAKDAYMKLNPSPALHDRMIEAARIWFASWAAQGKADAPRFTLAKWIDREEFDCDPPTVYKPKEKKAKATASKKEVVGDNDNPAEADTDADIPDWAIGRPLTWPVADLVGEFEGAVPFENGGDSYFDFTFVAYAPPRLAGKRFLHRICWQSSFATAQEEGQKYINAIGDAVGLPRAPEDTDDLLFKPLRVRSTGGKLIYSSMEAAT
ncbi:MAG: hypothetical protein QHC90_23155 [Shinella sp.]|nr:hypothetical protein [Shinella sp.]